MSRTTDRKHAFALLFQLPFHHDICQDEAMEEYLSQLEEDTDFNRVFIASEYKGAATCLHKTDSLIAKYSSGWEIGRINKVDLAIMRLAVYEMLFVEDIPISVSINEAVELAKTYGIDESAAFINGILGKIASVIPSSGTKIE